MTPYQTRVVCEKLDLDEKLHKLRLFFEGDAYSTLADRERDLLHQQVGHMESYSDVLGARIAGFK